jgi:hypothetical protein
MKRQNPFARFFIPTLVEKQAPDQQKLTGAEAGKGWSSLVL